MVFSLAIKPTPSISSKQETINIKNKENAEIEITGRHDPCIVPRAVPCIESAANLAILSYLI